MPSAAPDDSDRPHQAARELFDRALSLPLEQRVAFVRQQAHDAAMAEQVLAWLQAAGQDTAELLAKVRSGDPRGTGSSESDAATRGGERVQSTATGELLKKLATAPKLDTQRFQLEGELGKGGMGVVLRVHDQFLNRRLAMKVLIERGTPRDEAEQRLVHQLLGRFLEEAQVTSQLDHPGVVPVHELGLDHSGKVYFTMRMVKGTTASERFDDAFHGRGEWNLTRGLEVILRVCDTMAYAHDKGVLHRDLKPSNVMVGRFGEVYVMDWGLAKVIGQQDRHDLRIRADATTGVSKLETARKRDADTDAENSVVSMDGQQLGTPSYMSPEQARSEELDARADVYSIGAMMYELVTGSAPYAPKGLRLRAHRILEELTAGPPRRVDELRRDVPSALAAVIDKAMQRDRAHRYASVQQLADDIRAFLAQRVVSAHKTGAWEETKLWLRRNRQVAWSLAVTAATLVAGIVTTSVLWQGATLAREDAEMRGRQFEMLAMVVDYERMIASEPIGVGSPEQLPTMRAWTKETEGFLARVEPALRQPVQIDDTSTTSPSARDAARFLVGRMDELARNLPRLRSLLDAVATRQRWAEAVERLTLAHQHAAASWDEVRTAIATSPRYVGQNIDLSNANIWGLVPIGENPQSGLWEFYDLRSAWNGSSDPASLERAEIPKADSSGRLRLDGNTGIVWVLTPAGVVDTQTRSGPDGTTNRAVPIDPFLMSKYEVTRGQWHRWTGAHPSSSPREGEGALPVVDINWFTCDQILRLHGLAMPTELQAEHALRGGTKTPWWSGTEESSILLAENVGEGTKLLLVGSKQPNPFGLMDLGGNVWEWCQDQYGEYGAERHGDGRRPDSAEVLDRSIRGGGYGDRAERAKSEHRHKNLPTSRGPFLGVRPIRLLR